MNAERGADRGRTADDRGSTLVLGIGLAALCLLAGVVGIDVAAAFLQRQQLLALADAAALAGAQAIDLEAYYEHGASAATALDAAAVPVRVRRHLAAAGAASSVPGLRVEQVVSDRDDVRVVLSAPLSLPFWPDVAQAAMGERIVVTARARLAYREPAP